MLLNKISQYLYTYRNQWIIYHIMNYRGENISRIGNLDRCQSRFYSSYPVHRGITFNILPAFDFLPSTRKWKVSGRPSFQVSLVTSSNNRLPRALIELERSWLHELELHELITLRHFQPRTRMVVRIGPIYWNFPVIYQFGPFNGLITSWRWIGGGGRWHDVWSWRQL